MRSWLLLSVATGVLTACSPAASSNARTEPVTTERPGTITYALTSDQEFGAVVDSLFLYHPRQHLEHGTLVRITRPRGNGLEYRYLVPGPAAENTRTLYREGGMDAYLQGPMHRATAEQTVNNHTNFRVCDLQIVENPRSGPACQTISAD